MPRVANSWWSGQPTPDRIVWFLIALAIAGCALLFTVAPRGSTSVGGDVNATDASRLRVDASAGGTATTASQGGPVLCASMDPTKALARPVTCRQGDMLLTRAEQDDAILMPSTQAKVYTVETSPGRLRASLRLRNQTSIRQQVRSASAQFRLVVPGRSSLSGIARPTAQVPEGEAMTFDLSFGMPTKVAAYLATTKVQPSLEVVAWRSSGGLDTKRKGRIRLDIQASQRARLETGKSSNPATSAERDEVAAGAAGGATTPIGTP